MAAAERSLADAIRARHSDPDDCWVLQELAGYLGAQRGLTADARQAAGAIRLLLHAPRLLCLWCGV